MLPISAASGYAVPHAARFPMKPALPTRSFITVVQKGQMAYRAPRASNQPRLASDSRQVAVVKRETAECPGRIVFYNPFTERVNKVQRQFVLPLSIRTVDSRNIPCLVNASLEVALKDPSSVMKACATQPEIEKSAKEAATEEIGQLFKKLTINDYVDQIPDLQKQLKEVVSERLAKIGFVATSTSFKPYLTSGNVDQYLQDVTAQLKRARKEGVDEGFANGFANGYVIGHCTGHAAISTTYSSQNH